MKAYPNLQIVVSDMGQVRAVTQSEGGMDLRDYFAAKSLPLAFKVWENFHDSDENDATYKTSNFQMDGNYQELVANTAYQMADAMMKARSA